jgi:trehalose synthase
LIKDLKEKMGQKAKETVRKQFLMSRLVEEYLDLFNSFKSDFKLIRSS